MLIRPNALLDEMGLKTRCRRRSEHSPRGSSCRAANGAPAACFARPKGNPERRRSVGQPVGRGRYQVNEKVIDAQTWTDTCTAGTWDMFTYREEQAFALPFVESQPAGTTHKELFSGTARADAPASCWTLNRSSSTSSTNIKQLSTRTGERS